MEFTVDLVTIVVQSKSLIVLYHYQSSEDPSYTVSNRYADPIRREEGKLCGEGDVGNQGNVERCSDVKEHLKKTGRTGKDVYIFVSTDSDYAVKYISHQFEDCHCVYTVKDYEIGHSAAAASQGGNRK